jgi:hypothetical protein
VDLDATTTEGQLVWGLWVPAIVDWPNGLYSAELDVTAGDANIDFGLLDLGANEGHFGRIRFDAVHLDKVAQTQGAFSGTGIKTASATFNAASGAVTDGLEVVVALQHTSPPMHGASTWTIELNEADDIVQTPWATLVESTTAAVDGLLMKTQTETAALDSLLMEVRQVQAAIDAILDSGSVTYQETAALDALLMKVGQAATLLDGLLMKQGQETATLDALLMEIRQATASLDARIVDRFQETAALDGLLQKTQAEQVSLDGLLMEVRAANALLDGILMATQTEQASLDGLLQATQTTTASLDAILTGGAVTLTVTGLLDALLMATQAAVASLDSRLVRRLTEAVSVDGLLMKTIQETTALDGLVVESLWIPPVADVTTQWSLFGGGPSHTAAVDGVPGDTLDTNHLIFLEVSDGDGVVGRLEEFTPANISEPQTGSVRHLEVVVWAKRLASSVVAIVWPELRIAGGFTLVGDQRTPSSTGFEKLVWSWQVKPDFRRFEFNDVLAIKLWATLLAPPVGDGRLDVARGYVFMDWEPGFHTEVILPSSLDGLLLQRDTPVTASLDAYLASTETDGPSVTGPIHVLPQVEGEIQVTPSRVGVIEVTPQVEAEVTPDPELTAKINVTPRVETELEK